MKSPPARALFLVVLCALFASAAFAGTVSITSPSPGARWQLDQVLHQRDEGILTRAVVAPHVVELYGDALHLRHELLHVEPERERGTRVRRQVDTSPLR